MTTKSQRVLAGIALAVGCCAGLSLLCRSDDGAAPSPNLDQRAAPDQGPEPEPAPSRAQPLPGDKPVVPPRVEAPPLDAPTPPATTLTIEDMGAADQDRMRAVNAALKEAHLPGLPPGSRIPLGDIAEFRAIVDDAETSVSKAEDAWLKVATDATKKEVQAVLERLKSGETKGLPLLSRDNPMQRNHPHEAIAQISYGGKAYVVRVPPWAHEGLARSGKLHELECSRRTSSYNTHIRSLFQ